MTNTTSINTINIISAHIEGVIAPVVKDYVAKGYGLSDVDEVAKWSLRQLGIETRPYGEAEAWEDELFEMDHGRDGGVYLTWTGRHLVRRVHSWDFSGSPLNEEGLVSWGDPHYGYQGRILSNELPLEALIEVHKLVYQLLPSMIKKEKEEIASKKRSWGNDMNHQLEEVGCSKPEIQAWWSLQWKKEWSPEQWKRVCSTLTDAQVAAAMAAHSHSYLEAVGVNLGRSFPRTMDVIEALGKSRRLAPNRIKNWNKAEEGVVPSAVEKDGSRKWSF